MIVPSIEILGNSKLFRLDLQSPYRGKATYMWPLMEVQALPQNVGLLWLSPAYTRKLLAIALKHQNQ